MGTGLRRGIDSPVHFTVLPHRLIGDRDIGGDKVEVAWKVDVIVAKAATNRTGLRTRSLRSGRDIGTAVEGGQLLTSPGANRWYWIRRGRVVEGEAVRLNLP